jgi:ribulose kinase
MRQGNHAPGNTLNGSLKTVYLPVNGRIQNKRNGYSSASHRKSKCLKTGQNGLIVLDWWNGNRSTLVDADLTGVIVGATLRSLLLGKKCIGCGS